MLKIWAKVQKLFHSTKFYLLFIKMQSQQASAKLQKVFKKLYFWRRKF